MTQEINKIVVVGGGSAGWMSAATMIRNFPKKEVVIIESPDDPVVGVGESTLAAIKLWMAWLGVQEEEFMRDTDAVYKLSIKFTDWYKKDSGGFHYPFGRPYVEGSLAEEIDWYIKKAKYPMTTANSDYAKTFFPAVTLAEKNKINLNADGRLGNFLFFKDVAYHFDAIKFGQWLKKKYCIPKGVKVISAKVTDIKTNENGVEYLQLSNGDKVSGDLFIDCTGWKSLLLGGALKEPFLDDKELLPNNRAWATRIPYTDKEKEMEPYTNCTAIENGWVWNIPSWERIGTGYVYSDKYITPEEALKQFKNYLKSDKLTIPDENRPVEDFEYKDIKFRVGIHRRLFVKNVVGIGLAGGFIEPLESNGLFTTHVFLIDLIKVLNRGGFNQFDRDCFNLITQKGYEGFRDFVLAHYLLSYRNDTKYWQDITSKSFFKEGERLDQSMTQQFKELVFRKIASCRYDIHNGGGIHCIGTGLGFMPIDKNVLSSWDWAFQTDHFTHYEKVFQSWKMRTKEWERIADRSPTMYEFLKENIYKE